MIWYDSLIVKPLLKHRSQKILNALILLAFDEGEFQKKRSTNKEIAGCKSRLLFAKIAMAVWFQVSGVRCQETCSVVIGKP
ncbi:MAG: hypothetical protein SRB2_00692 [Desulfobacteraceae bacterium Eth-SRB2]|nr:MAG: hypothetical protein SRB2_00692 [Desulfobacteraceae bacterium Eth-SRB2]